MSFDGLSRIPDELLDLCCRYSDGVTLRALRLTNKKCCRSATTYLYERIKVLPTDESARRCISIMNSPLNPSVRALALYTSPENLVNVDRTSDWAPEVTLVEAFEYVLAHLGRFENIVSVALNSHNYSAVERHKGFGESYDGSASETESFRTMVLEKLVGAINHPDHPARKLRELAVKNLQDQVNVPLVTSSNFLTALRQLDSLSLHIAVLIEDRHCEGSYFHYELHQFFENDLITYWLQPTQAQLVNLTLSSRLEWGFYPECDLRKLFFPKLRTLSLGELAFWRHWQVEWIISHHTTLESLILTDCRIVFFSDIDEDQNLGSTVIKKDFRSGSRQEPKEWYYHERWHDYFNLFEIGLSQLKDFTFASRSLSQRMDTEDLLTYLGETYCWYCDTGISYSIELEHENEVVDEDGKSDGLYEDTGWPKFEHGCDEKDVKAYCQLQRTIKGRI